MNHRKEILAKIADSISAPAGKSTGGSGAGAIGLDKRREIVRARIASHPVGVIPKASGSKKAIVKKFIEKVKAAEASIISTKPEKIGDCITSYLRQHNLPQSLRCGLDERLDPALKQLGDLVDVSKGKSNGDDLVGLSHATNGVAETGTLLMTSGEANPTTLNFLPENHIVLIKESDILSSYEEALEKVRSEYGTGQMPRTVNLITGPSRSADIEQTLILGAHGPVRLHVIVLKDSV